MSGTDFYYDQEIHLAERLAKLAPMTGQNRVFFTNSGAEAIEAAFKLARHQTGRQHVIAFWGAVSRADLRRHVALGQQGHPSQPLHADGAANHPRDLPQPLPPHDSARDSRWSISRWTNSNTRSFGAKWRRRKWQPSSSSRSRAKAAISSRRPTSCRASANSAIGTASCWFATKCSAAWAARARCGRANTSSVEPDIIAIAKGIASGMPLGAILAREDIMNWPPGSHASTFGGNPVACAAAQATLDLLEGGLIDNAAARRRLLERRAARGAGGVLLHWRRARLGTHGGRRHRGRSPNPPAGRRAAIGSWKNVSAAACCCWAAAKARSASARR